MGYTLSIVGADAGINRWAAGSSNRGALALSSRSAATAYAYEHDLV
jgi:hypothetical protein